MKKAKILSMLLAVVMMMGMFATVVLGTTVKELLNEDNVKGYTANTDSGSLGDTVKTPVQAVLGIITVIAGAVVVGILIFIGIKYMTKGAGAKAEVKDTLIPYLIGAVLIGGASALANAVITMGSNI